MRVRLSRDAAGYVRQESGYLRRHSRIAAERFLQSVTSVRRDLERFEAAGFADESLPIAGLRRFIRDGYRYDYRVFDDWVEIAAISNSINTPLQGPSDDPDFDYEA